LVFFLHIPKTGGVSLYELIEPNFELEEIFPVPDPVESRRMFAELSPEKLAGIRLVRGHFWFGPGDWGVHDFLAHDPITITLLRDPVSRTVSVYQFVMAHPELWLAKKIMRPDVKVSELVDHELEDGEIQALKSIGIAEFARHPVVRGELRNLQARLVVGRTVGDFTPDDDPSVVQRISDRELLDAARARLEDFAFVGLTERFEESVAALADYFGWSVPTPTPHKNAAEEPSESIELSRTDREAILEQVEVDCKLYEHARGIFESRIEARQLASR
jgi:hypothetical protein